MPEHTGDGMRSNSQSRRDRASGCAPGRADRRSGVSVTALIGLDWGTSSLRAYRIGADGRVLQRRETAAGILSVEGGDFAGAFEAAVGDWLTDPARPVLAAGMIGSRQGWREAPYLACPADLADLAGGLVEVRTGRGGLHLVPGLSFESESGVPDVMRGEETQILGALGDQGAQGLFVLPGTHSKWAVVEAGRVTRFRTMMTGEVFQALKSHTILGRLMRGEGDDPAAFASGVALAGPGGGGLLGHLFSVRTQGLFGRLPESALSSYLSGLLLGSEIEEAKAWLGAGGADGLTLIGASALAARYQSALRARGLDATPGSADAAARGLHRIARAAGMLA